MCRVQCHVEGRKRDTFAVYQQALFKVRPPVPQRQWYERQFNADIDNQRFGRVVVHPRPTFFGRNHSLFGPTPCCRAVRNWDCNRIEAVHALRRPTPSKPTAHVPNDRNGHLIGGGNLSA